MTKEEILEPHRLYILPEIFGKQGQRDKVTFQGALTSMDKYAKQQCLSIIRFMDRNYFWVFKDMIFNTMDNN